MSQLHLIDHIRENSLPLEPLPTGEKTIISGLSGIKAVVFDIYGTLFVSGSGDISLAKKEDRSPALVAALGSAGFKVLNEQAAWSGAFMDSLEKFRERRVADGITFPEVRIEEVWKDLIDTAQQAGWINGSGDLELAIVDYECRVNPCWPLPGLASLLKDLGDGGLSLGIVSNAQFYTPLLFPALLGKNISEFAFNEDYSVWSYKEREGKPSPHLYQKLKDNLAVDGISPADVLYVGNDLRNDIWPAHELGFQTALFAGDARSLRWRQDDPACQDVRPDFVITDLDQVRQIVCLPEV